MPQKLFLYTDDAADKDMQAYFKKKDYALTPLTADPKDFWKAVDTVGAGGYLALMSHGDQNGPLMVAGTKGADMTAQEITNFGAKLVNAKITLYLLACHTGLDPFLSHLNATKCTFVAPIGYAKAVSSVAGAAVYSVKDLGGSDYVGWAGAEALVPNRNTKPLNIQ